MSSEQATIISDILVDADMYGVTTHGTAILPSHIKRIVCGGYNLTPNISTVNSSPSFSVKDADNAIGFVGAKSGDRKHSAYRINLENGVDICEDVRQLLKV